VSMPDRMSDSERREARSDAGPGGRLRRIVDEAVRVVDAVHRYHGVAAVPWDAINALAGAVNDWRYADARTAPATPAPRDERDAAKHTEQEREAHRAYIRRRNELATPSPGPSERDALREAVEALIGEVIAVQRAIDMDRHFHEHARLGEAIHKVRAALAAPRPAPPAEGLTMHDALRKWGRHFETCPGSHPAWCTCGLADFMRRTAPPGHPSPPAGDEGGRG
jgi:hypothetical protein